jgi:hypothetical protein
MSGGGTFGKLLHAHTVLANAFLPGSDNSILPALPHSVISGISVAWIFKLISLICSLSLLSGYSSSFQKQMQNRIFL